MWCGMLHGRSDSPYCQPAAGCPRRTTGSNCNRHDPWSHAVATACSITAPVSHLVRPALCCSVLVSALCRVLGGGGACVASCEATVPCSCMAMCAVSGDMSLLLGLSACSTSSCRWMRWSFSQQRGEDSSATSDEYTLQLPKVSSREEEEDAGDEDDMAAATTVERLLLTDRVRLTLVGR